MNNLKIYDWALDDRAIKFSPPVEKGVCPKGHICKRSSKPEMERYFYCNECEHDDDFSYNTMDGTKSKGLYYSDRKIEILLQYINPVPGWYEIEI